MCCCTTLTMAALSHEWHDGCRSDSATDFFRQPTPFTNKSNRLEWFLLVGQPALAGLFGVRYTRSRCVNWWQIFACQEDWISLLSVRSVMPTANKQIISIFQSPTVVRYRTTSPPTCPGQVPIQKIIRWNHYYYLKASFRFLPLFCQQRSRNGRTSSRRRTYC